MTDGLGGTHGTHGHSRGGGPGTRGDGPDTLPDIRRRIRGDVAGVLHGAGWTAEPSVRVLLLGELAGETGEPLYLSDLTDPQLWCHTLVLACTRDDRPSLLPGLARALHTLEPGGEHASAVHRAADEWEAAAHLGRFVPRWTWLRLELTLRPAEDLRELLLTATDGRIEQPPAHCVTVWDLFLYLVGLAAPPDGVPPWMTLLDRVARDLGPRTQRDLPKLTRHSALELGGPDLAARLDRARWVRRTPAAADRPSVDYLLIGIAPDPLTLDWYTVSYWLQSPDERGRMVTTPGRTAHRVRLSQATLRDPRPPGHPDPPRPSGHLGTAPSAPPASSGHLGTAPPAPPPPSGHPETAPPDQPSPSGSSGTLPPAPPPPSVRDTQLAALEEAVNEIVSLVEVEEGARGRGADLRLEFVLPLALLNLPVHWWSAGHGGSRAKLAARYEVVLRSLDRLRNQGWYREWIKRWKRLQSGYDCEPVFMTADSFPGDGRDASGLVARLNDERYVAVMLSEPPDPWRTRGPYEAEAALSSGLPVLLWHRTEEANVEIERSVHQLLRGRLPDLPARVAAARRQVLVRTPEANPVTEHLAVLWDDPGRNPLLPPDDSEDPALP